MGFRSLSLLVYKMGKMYAFVALCEGQITVQRKTCNLCIQEEWLCPVSTVQVSSCQLLSPGYTEKQECRRPFSRKAWVIVSALLILHMSEVSKSGRMWKDNMRSVPRTGTQGIRCHLMPPFLEDIDGWLRDQANGSIVWYGHYLS